MKLTNNQIAFLAILLIIASLTSNLIIYKKIEIKVTGKATAHGYVSICINHPPVLNEFPSNLTVREGQTLIYDVNATDYNNATQNITFYDNTTLFDISPSTGIINFTAPGNSAGLYHILITAQDNSTCSNSNDTQTLVLNITSENVAPSITSYYPLGNPTITEEQTRLFNISYEDADGNVLAVYWYLNNSLISLFNDTSSVLKSNYTFTGNYTNAGIYTVKVIVSDSLLNDSHTWTLTVTDVNRVPSFIRTIKNQTWAEDSILYGLDLDDYGYDPDTDDTLSYSVNYLTDPHSIIVSINENNTVTFSQPADWYGSENISFTITDNHGATNTSNNITLTVYDVPETNITIGRVPSTGTGKAIECIEYWFCTYWSVCYPDGYMKRTCTDLSECGTEDYKPAETERCDYIPSCFNGVQDGKETGTDCGGPCGLCPTCFDSLMNNDETGIDCGGSCPPCPTCSDGIINGGEIGIDCGGACPLQDCCKNGYRDAHLKEEGIDCGGLCKECAVEIEKPAPKILFWTAMSVISLIILIISIIIYLNRERVKLFFLLITKRYKKKEIIAPMKKREKILSRINKLEREIKSKSAEDALKEFLRALRTVFVMLFGIKYEFTYEEIRAIIKESNLKPIVKSILLDYVKRIIHVAYSEYKISKNELTLLIKELMIIIYLITKSNGEKLKRNNNIEEKGKYENELEKIYALLSKSLFMLERLEIEKAKKLYTNSKDVFNKLSLEEREEANNYILRIEREIELFEKKGKKNKRAKDLFIITISLIILLFLGNLNKFFESRITGLSVVEETISKDNLPSIIDIPQFNIKVGEHFVYRVRAYDKEDTKLYFSEDTKLFNITPKGIIEFIPTGDNTGIHHVTIIVKNSNYKTSFQGVIFNITGLVTKETETVTPNETQGSSELITQEVDQTNETPKEIQETQLNERLEEINITETNKTEDLSEEINMTQEINETEKINITQEINKTNETFFDNKSQDFFIKPLSISADGFELGNIAKLNLLIENYNVKGIENAYFKIIIENNSATIMFIQSEPINIAPKEKKEISAQLNTNNITIGNYTGKLIIAYEDKTSENEIIVRIEKNQIKAEILGITGMITASSSTIKTKDINLIPILIWIALIIILAYSIQILFYLKREKEKKRR